MKKSEFQKLIKPIVKECIKEVMFEEGILSKVVSEVAKGMSVVQAAPPATRLQETVDVDMNNMQKIALTEKRDKAATQQRKKILDAIGRDAYNGVDLFEGTTPLSGKIPAPGAAASPQGPLAGTSPGDPGVDISNLFGAVGSHWKALAGGKAK